MGVRRVVAGLIVGWLLAGAVHAATLEVAVHDYAGVPAGELRAAEAEAQRFYRAAGIELAWVHCRAHRFAELRCPNGIAGGALVMNLLPPAMTMRRMGEDDALGYAWAGARIASILIAPTGALADRALLPPGEVMGMVMAHELGHLLLGPRAHSWRGIMQPHWSARTLWRLRAGPYFAPAQQRRLAAWAAAHGAGPHGPCVAAQPHLC